MPRTSPALRLLCVSAVAGVAVLGAAPFAYAESGGPADTADPVVSSLVVAPDAVDVSTQDASVVVSTHLLDAGSGVTTVTVRLVSPDAVAVPLSLLSGDANDGIWTGSATVPAFAAHGAAAAYLDATDADGNVASAADASALDVADAAPAAPGAVTATPVEGVPGALTVGWADPAANGGSAVEGYDVTAAPADPAAAVSSPAPVVAAADAHSATLTGLAAETAYVVRVTARNAVGTGAAGTVAATTAPPAPTAPGVPATVAASPFSTAVDVSWTPPVSDGRSPVTGYSIRVSSPVVTGPEPVVVEATSLAVTVPGLLNGVPYDVAVTALNAVGPGLPAVAHATPRTVPGAPAIGTVTPGNASAVVRWAAPAGDGGDAVHAYLVSASTGGAPKVVPGTARSVTVGGLANGVPVRFSVVAVNDAGPGPASALSASVVPRQPVKLVVVTQPAAAIVYGTTTGVRGALRTVAGIGLPGRPVELDAQVRPSTTWKRVASGTTDSHGEVVLRVLLPANAALRLRHAPDALSAPDAAVRSVNVAPSVTRAANAVRFRIGGTLVVTGRIAPAFPAGSAVRLQRWTSTGWANVANGTMTTTSAYRVAWKPGSAGAWTMRVVKPADTAHGAGVSATWRQQVDPENAADIARAIRANTRITLTAVHTSGVVDAATAKQNIADLSNGLLSRRSSYENAPGGATAVDLRVLRALRRMGTLGTVTVTEITGGSHAVGSLHYSGRALDISYVNGRHVAPGSSYQIAIDACRAFGATRVFSPSYDPYGGHSNHVHCDW